MLKSLLNFLFSFIYPQKCLLCGDIIPYGTEGIFCADCLPKIAYIDSGCPICGRPGSLLHNKYNRNEALGFQTGDGFGIKFEAGSVCFGCEGREFRFAMNRAAAPYDDYMSKMIYRFKYGKRQEYGRSLGLMMAGRYYELFGDTVIDYVVPVPLHRKRYAGRGFNQAEMLAAEIAKSLGVPLVKRMLTRIIDTKPQSSLNKSERAKNLKGAFRYNKSSGININGKNIMLVDDIFTTGSTMSVCAALIIKHGAANVYGYTLAIVPE